MDKFHPEAVHFAGGLAWLFSHNLVFNDFSMLSRAKAGLKATSYLLIAQLRRLYAQKNVVPCFARYLPWIALFVAISRGYHAFARFPLKKLCTLLSKRRASFQSRQIIHFRAYGILICP